MALASSICQSAWFQQLYGTEFKATQRSYLLYCGGIGDIGVHDIPEYHHQLPEYWFPEDKSWCVATDMDLLWTYVGGSRPCTDAVLKNPDFESVPADLDDGLTVQSDEVNALSDEE